MGLGRAVVVLVVRLIVPCLSVGAVVVVVVVGKLVGVAFRKPEAHDSHGNSGLSSTTKSVPPMLTSRPRIEKNLNDCVCVCVCVYLPELGPTTPLAEGIVQQA